MKEFKLIFDIKREKKLKVQFLLRTQFTLPLGFCPHVNHSATRILTIGIKAWFDNFSKFLKMVRKNQTYVEGASIDKPPLFTSENYLF